MSRTTETLTISMPSAFRRKLDRVCKQERRSRSEVVREALRIYFALCAPAEELTAAERADLRRGRAEIVRGEYLTLEQFNDKMASLDSATHRSRH